jgi:hypothetical protein
MLGDAVAARRHAAPYQLASIKCSAGLVISPDDAPCVRSCRGSRRLRLHAAHPVRPRLCHRTHAARTVRPVIMSLQAPRPEAHAAARTACRRGVYVSCDAVWAVVREAGAHWRTRFGSCAWRRAQPSCASLDLLICGTRPYVMQILALCMLHAQTSPMQLVAPCIRILYVA